MFLLFPAVNCGNPSTPSSMNAITITTTNTTFMGVTTYACDYGYRISGNGNSNKRTCTSSGTWTGSAPICECKNYI